MHCVTLTEMAGLDAPGGKSKLEAYCALLQQWENGLTQCANKLKDYANVLQADCRASICLCTHLYRYNQLLRIWLLRWDSVFQGGIVSAGSA